MNQPKLFNFKILRGTWIRGVAWCNKPEANAVICGGNTVIFWVLFKIQLFLGENTVVLGENLVFIEENRVVFGANTVVFRANTVIFSLSSVRFSLANVCFPLSNVSCHLHINIYAYFFQLSVTV